MIDAIMYFEPQIPGSEKYGKEPNLYKMVLRYYQEYFTREESERLTETYFEALSKADTN